jgi:flagellar protein FlgJ
MTPIAQFQIPSAGESLQASMERSIRGKDDTAAVREVTQQFEAILVRQILNTAHIGSAFGGASGASMTNEVYRDMMVSQLADQISQSGDIGMAKQMEKQLVHTMPDAKPSTVGGAHGRAKTLEAVWTD